MFHTEIALGCFPLAIDGKIVNVCDIYMEDF